MWFWCNIVERAARQSHIHSAAHVKWFNMKMWCYTHIWTWNLCKGNILHPSLDHREGVTFSYSKAIFHVDSLLSFNLAKQFPLTWWDRVDGGADEGAEAAAAQELENSQLKRLWRKSSDCCTCERIPKRWLWSFWRERTAHGSRAGSHLGIKSSDFCVEGREIRHSSARLGLAPTCVLAEMNERRPQPALLSVRQK